MAFFFLFLLANDARIVQAHGTRFANRFAMSNKSWIEVIHIRANHNTRIETMLATMPVLEGGLRAVKIYRRQDIETDLRIHLEWEASEVRDSAIGHHLVEVFTDSGLIDHSIWLEVDSSNDGSGRSGNNG